MVSLETENIDDKIYYCEDCKKEHDYTGRWRKNKWVCDSCLNFRRTGQILNQTSKDQNVNDKNLCYYVKFINHYDNEIKAVESVMMICKKNNGEIRNVCKICSEWLVNSKLALNYV